MSGFGGRAFQACFFLPMGSGVMLRVGVSGVMGRSCILWGNSGILYENWLGAT